MKGRTADIVSCSHVSAVLQKYLTHLVDSLDCSAAQSMQQCSPEVVLFVDVGAVLQK